MKTKNQRPKTELLLKPGSPFKQLDRHFTKMVAREFVTMFKNGFRLSQIDERLFTLEIRLREIRRRLEKGLALRPEFDREQLLKSQKTSKSKESEAR